MEFSDERPFYKWCSVVVNSGDSPCQRSLHVAAVYNKKLFLFGGYDGSNRVNDFYEFDFMRRNWMLIPLRGSGPSPRDRHIGVVHAQSFVIFGGYDGSTRVNDCFAFDFTTRMWRQLLSQGRGEPPTPRHSHSACVYKGCMYVFGT